MPRPSCLVVQVEGAGLGIVRRNRTDLLLTALAGEHIVMPMVIIDEACFPQRVQLLDVCANLHLDARHAVRIFAIRQITTASIAVTRNHLSRAGLPRHSRGQHCG